MEETTPEQFLKSKGINFNTTAFNTVIDGYMRQPDLTVLFNEFASLRLREFFEKEYSKFQNKEEPSERAILTVETDQAEDNIVHRPSTIAQCQTVCGITFKHTTLYSLIPSEITCSKCISSPHK